MTDLTQKNLELEKKARTIINQAYDAFVEIDVSGNIIDWNHQSEIIFGWSREEVIGKALSETIIPARYREGHRKGLEHTRVTGEGPILNKRIEISALHRDGQEFSVELAVFPVSTEGTVSFCAFIRDIRERKSAADALQSQAELLNLTNDAVIMRDLDGTIRYSNRGAKEMYGFTEAEMIGHRSHDLFKTKFPIPYEQIEQAICIKGRWEGELVHHVRDGRKIIVASRQTLKVDLEGKPVAVLEINSDITERKLTEQRQQVLAEIKRSNLELEQFAYIASHDLQEPLRAVAGCLQILEKTYKGKLDDNADELIHLAIDGAIRMRALISDLLSLSRVSSGEVTFERVDLSLLLEQALKNMKTTIEETGAKITHDALPILTVEKTQLTQLFQNLISNALKFHGDKPPEIHVGTVQHDDQWQFSVRDNGIGFEAEHSEKIFEPFKRLHGRDKYPGTGIGLAICKRIVERHRGRIWVESKPGEGTTFYFTIADTEGA